MWIIKMSYFWTWAFCYVCTTQFSVHALASSITFFDQPDYKGQRYQMQVNRCENIPPEFDNMVSSVRTKTCVVLYADNCCQGRVLQIYKDDDISWTTLNHKVSSVSPCGSYRTVLPKQINETWGDHNDTMTKVIEYQDVAVYHDERLLGRSDMWHADFITQLWGYTKATYGNFGPEDGPLLLFLHGISGSSVISPRIGPVKSETETFIGKSLNYFDTESKCRNLIDIGVTGENVGVEMDIIAKEVAGIVEWSAKGVWNNPSRGLWDYLDSPWAEIFSYDAFLQMDLKEDAERAFQKFSNISRNYPREESFWFRDWYYPIYKRYGGARVLNGYFELLSRYFPRALALEREWSFDRLLNDGEYVHFMSGVCGYSIQEQYEVAFDWSSDTDFDLTKAKRDFPDIRYQG